MCGGTVSSSTHDMCRRGLSPRVRGNLTATLTARQWTRSIPACAGEPIARRDRDYAASVYPRVCGGTWYQGASAALGRGLSPRVRGNRQLRQIHLIRHRSIPACAGEPRRGGGMDGPQPVYPRVCGGTHARRRQTRNAAGLSPRVRGNPPAGGTAPPLRRSIPACAGEPPGRAAGCDLQTVYPRVCGGTRHRH